MKGQIVEPSSHETGGTPDGSGGGGGSGNGGRRQPFAMSARAARRAAELDHLEASHAGVAFVSFAEPSSATAAIQAINDTAARHALAVELPALDDGLSGDELEGAEALEAAGTGADDKAAAAPSPAAVGNESHGGCGSIAGATTARAGGHSEALASTEQRVHVVARRAPEPSDVSWENLQIGPREQFRRQVVSTSVMLALACIGTCIIATVVYVNGTHLYSSLIQLLTGLEGLMAALALQLGMALPIIVGHVILFIAVPILAERYERHHTFAEMERAIMLKLTFFQSFNTIVAAASFWIEPTVRAEPRRWYSLGGATIANVMFGDAIFIQVLLDLVQIPIVISRSVVAPRAATQQAMDQAYIAPAGIYLAFRLQLAGKFVVICTSFGSAIPLLYLIGAFYFWLAAWIDRYNLLRRLAPPPVTDASLTSAMALIVFPAAVGMHVVLALVFFAALPAMAPPTTDHPPSSAAPTAPAAAIAPLPPPPPPPIGIAPVDDQYDAFHIQLFTTMIACAALALFTIRECARLRGWQLPTLLSDYHENAILRVITQV